MSLSLLFSLTIAICFGNNEARHSIFSRLYSSKSLSKESIQEKNANDLMTRSTDALEQINGDKELFCSKKEIIDCRKQTNIEFVNHLEIAVTKEKEQLNQEIKRLEKSYNKSPAQWWIKDLSDQSASLSNLERMLDKIGYALSVSSPDFLDDMPKFENLNQIRTYLESKKDLFEALTENNRFSKGGFNLSKTPKEDQKAALLKLKEMAEHGDRSSEVNFYPKVYWGEDTDPKIKFERLKYFLQTAQSSVTNQSGCRLVNGKKTEDCKAPVSIVNPPPRQSPCLADHPVLAMVAYEMKHSVLADTSTQNLLTENLNLCSPSSNQSNLLKQLLLKSYAGGLDSKICGQIARDLDETVTNLEGLIGRFYERQFPECRDSRSIALRKHFREMGNDDVLKGMSPITAHSFSDIDLERMYFLMPVDGCQVRKELSSLRQKAAKSIAQLRAFQELRQNEDRISVYHSSPKRGLEVNGGLDPQLYSSKQGTMPMEERFSHGPTYQGEKTYSCVAHGLSSAIGEKRGSNKAIELNAIDLDQRFRTKGFGSSDGAIQINNRFLTELAHIEVPSKSGEGLLRTAHSSFVDFGPSNTYDLLELKKLAKGPGFVALIDTDTRVENGNQVLYTYKDASMGHTFHVINYSDKHTNIQTGQKEPMFQVRDSASINSMTRWMSAEELAYHLKGLVVIDKVKDQQSH